MLQNKEVNVKELRNLYNHCWSKETCHPLFKKDWVPYDRAIGQNDITALSIRAIFGGVILFCNTRKCDRYFWNRLPNGREIDLTLWPRKLRLSELKSSVVVPMTELMIFRSGKDDQYFVYGRFVILHRKVFELLRRDENLLEGFA